MSTILDTNLRIGTKIAQNRLVMPPMQTGKTNHGHVTDALVEYYRERALFSTPGIIITEHSCASEDGRASETQLSIATDDCVEEHRRLTDAIHEGGCLAFVQLNHAGSNGINAPVSASNINIPPKKDAANPRPLDASEFPALVQAFASAAKRAVDAGYDGVELHCAHAYLLNQFYSPLTNNRKDIYGGSVQNRLRLTEEIIAAVQAEIGNNIPLAVRLGGADYLPGGSTEEDAVEAAILLEQAGIDMLDITGGMCFFHRAGHQEAGYFSSMSEKIRNAVQIPVMLTGGITNRTDAEHLLEEGKADLIGIGRALLKDPKLNAPERR